MVERQRHDRAFAVGYHCCDILFSFGPNAPFHFDPADVRCVVAFQLCSVATTTFGKSAKKSDWLVSPARLGESTAVVPSIAVYFSAGSSDVFSSGSQCDGPPGPSGNCGCVIKLDTLASIARRAVSKQIVNSLIYLIEKS